MNELPPAPESDPRPNSREDIGGPLGYSRAAPPPRPPPVLHHRTARDTTPKNGGTMPKETAAPEEPKDEGTRGFDALLRQIDDGELHAELSEETRKLVADLTAFAQKFQREGKGSLVLTLNFAAMGNGTIAIAGDVKAKTPKAKRAASVFFRTHGNNLTVENPRQQKLPLREVPVSTTKPRELPADAGDARSV